MPNGFEFSVANWCAWRPEKAAGARQRPQPGHDHTGILAGTADARVIPARIRRRLDTLGRMAATVALACLEDQPPTPMIFASRHGSLDRTVTLLNDLAREEPLSPAAFSLSVHNAVPGLLSIARQDRSPATALAAGPDSLGAAILEAAGQLHAGASQTLVVYADSPVCEPYSDPLACPASPISLALLLRASTDTPRAVALCWRESHPVDALPDQLLAFLMADSPQAALGMTPQHWALKRADAA